MEWPEVAGQRARCIGSRGTKPRPTHFPIVRGRYPEPESIHGVENGGQGRNRTIDTRIFNTTESPVRCEQAEDLGRVSAGPTEPRADVVPQARLVLAAIGCQSTNRRNFGVDFSSTSAIRVCQPGPVAFQFAITSGGSRSDRSLRGFCNFGRPLRTSFAPRYTSAPAIHSSVISGGSLKIAEVRPEPFRFALMTMPHADNASGRSPRSPDEHD